MTVDACHRPTILAASLLIPWLVGMIGLAWFEQGPRATKDGVITPFGELLRSAEVEEVFRVVQTGVDVNRAIPFEDADLTGSRTVFVTPLLIATAANRDNTVAMLLSFGTRLDAPGNEHAVCLARRMGNDALATLLIQDSGGIAPTGCPAGARLEEGQAPLGAFALPPP